MRDRLIALLKQFDFDYGEECVLAAEGEGYKCAPDFAEYFADHLLANGVIVPPCTAEDTVYWISSDGHIIKSKLATITTVFLTKEQAEKALAEREGK